MPPLWMMYGNIYSPGVLETLIAFDNLRLFIPIEPLIKYPDETIDVEMDVVFERYPGAGIESPYVLSKAMRENIDSAFEDDDVYLGLIERGWGYNPLDFPLVYMGGVIIGNFYWWSIGVGPYEANREHLIGETSSLFVKIKKDDMGKAIRLKGRARTAREVPGPVGGYASTLYQPGDLVMQPYVFVHAKKPFSEIVRRQHYYGPKYISPVSLMIGDDLSRVRAELERAPKPDMASLSLKAFDLIKPPAPDIRFIESIIPSDVVAAGEPLSMKFNFGNWGAEGKAKMLLDGVEKIFSAPKATPVTPPMTFEERMDMPYFDFARNYALSLFGLYQPWLRIDKLIVEGKEYQPLSIPGIFERLTDTKSFSTFIPAGFPWAELGKTEAPDMLKPGDAFNVDFPITNTGYKGDVGVRMVAPGFQQDVMQRIDSGATITPRFSGEMPVTESYKVTAIPLNLGRNKQTVLGAEKIIEVTPMNALFHQEQKVKIFGGYPEGNDFTGFVAGKNVTVRGLTITPGTGPLPFGYAGYMLTGTLGEGKSAEIEFDELYFLRVEAVKGIAAAKLGTLISRDIKRYEYSVIPTPAMASYAFKSIGSLLTRARPRLEVR